MEKILPKNWVETELGSYIYLKNGFAYKTTQFTDSGIPVLKISNITKSGKVDLSNAQYVHEKYINNSFIVQKGDILIAMSGATTGKYGIYKEDELVLQNQRVGNIKLHSEKHGNKQFVLYMIAFLKKEIEERAYGGAQPNISPSLIETIKIPLPPLAEQERIVAKLDALFAQQEVMKKSLERIPALLKDFRQQVLAQAVTGKLTESWRENKELEDSDKLFDKIYKFKYEWANNEILEGNKEAKRLLSKLKKVKSIKNDDIPNNWGYFSLLDITHLVVDCHNKTAPYEENGIYLIRTTNIKNGQIVLKDIRFVSDKTYQFWSKRCIPQSGDILFTREAPMGEAAIIPNNMQVCLGQRTMLIRTPSELLLNQYVLYCLLSNKMSLQIEEKAIGTGVKHLRVGDVENLLIPIPPYNEQQEIVLQVESLFAKVDAIEQRYKNLKEKIDILPQAILHKAFKGELVPQLPTDGDAKDLLKMIAELKGVKK